MNKMKFKCSECGGTQLEEIMIGVVLISTVSNIVEQDGEYDMEYMDNSNEDGVVDKFQCHKCGSGACTLADLQESGQLTKVSEDSA